MALASNPLLTALTAANVQKASASTAIKAPEPAKDSASSFSSVFAKQATPKPSSVDDSPSKPASAKTSAPDSKNDASRPPAARDKTVAASGNDLPAKKVDPASDNGAAADAAKTSAAKTSAADDDIADAKDPAKSPTDDPVVSAALPDPVPDPALLAPLPVAVPLAPVVDQQPVADPALLASAAQSVAAPMVAQPAVSPVKAEEQAFDPSSDPLAGLTAVQVALDSNKPQVGAHAPGDAGKSATTANAKLDPNLDPAQQLAGNLAALGDKPVDDSTTEGGGDKAFGGLLADGLKDVKSASSDTRVDNFADRLAALSQAAQVKPSSTAPAPTLNQPLAMNQSGWTESVVNRVMYLSSQNLKQADIQLEPAELGRLDIRVNMAADQQTQVTFMSGHVGVREALESQMSRLRDSFAQQGMGQVDVNVSDQSRGWQQQAQQQSGGDGQRNSGSSRSSGSDLIADGAPIDAASAAASASLTVIGSSAVDYYA